MEKEQLELSTDYKKGYNAAWRLSEEMPQVFKGLQVPGIKKDDYSKGFDDGRMQFVKEHNLTSEKKENLRDQIRGQSQNTKHRGRKA